MDLSENEYFFACSKCNNLICFSNYKYQLKEEFLFKNYQKYYIFKNCFNVISTDAQIDTVGKIYLNCTYKKIYCKKECNITLGRVYFSFLKKISDINQLIFIFKSKIK